MVSVYFTNYTLGKKTQLTVHSGSDLEPVGSPDGKEIVFTTNRDGNYELYKITPEGTGLTRLTDNPANDLSPNWSPDSREIIFAENNSGSYDICKIDSDGNNKVILSDDSAVEYDPAWSPDGSKIAYVSNDEIWLMDSDGSNKKRLTNGYIDGNPEWSPDGETIIYASLRNKEEPCYRLGKTTEDKDTSRRIYSMNVDGTNQVCLTNPEHFASMPAWSFDGSRIVYEKKMYYNFYEYYLVIMNSDGSEKWGVTHEAINARSPSWILLNQK
jgi:Tol biopolymer transport system component